MNPINYMAKNNPTKPPGNAITDAASQSEDEAYPNLDDMLDVSVVEDEHEQEDAEEERDMLDIHDFRGGGLFDGAQEGVCHICHICNTGFKHLSSLRYHQKHMVCLKPKKGE